MYDMVKIDIIVFEIVGGGGLLKKKCGDHTDKNNYRPIALSSIISKVFEHNYNSRAPSSLSMDKRQYIWF